ncbi:MAG: ATP-binding protein [Thermoplasmata archaeon]
MITAAVSSREAGDAVVEEEEDRELYVKCPTCGRISEACEHVSHEDIAIIKRLIRAGVMVYESEDDLLEEDIFEEAEASPDRPDIYRLIDPRFTLEDVVLGPGALEAIEDAMVELENKRLLFETWGLSGVFRKVKGLSMLFVGAPGTGKTMTAEAIANATGKPLMIVNYAQMENMWVGETEKNIERVFRESIQHDAVLFFDEADAVFYRRGQTTAPWANRDVNVLLSHLEDFPGVVILATNMAMVMDQALDRRIDIAVEFEFPNEKMRREIFTKTMPAVAPLAEDVSFTELARKYPLSGGHILNVIRQAMRYAARREGASQKITMQDLKRAAGREMAKSELMRINHLSAGTDHSSRDAPRYHG